MFVVSAAKEEPSFFRAVINDLRFRIKISRGSKNKRSYIITFCNPLMKYSQTIIGFTNVEQFKMKIPKLIFWKLKLLQFLENGIP